MFTRLNFNLRIEVPTNNSFGEMVYSLILRPGMQAMKNKTKALCPEELHHLCRPLQGRKPTTLLALAALLRVLTHLRLK
jgi:hypothetical protein